MGTLNFIVKRIVSWPLLIVGVTLIHAGGALVRFVAWGLDVELPK
jgi:hypothetical protein